MTESTATPPHRIAGGHAADAWLRRSAVTWYLVAAIGQLAFIHFILAFFGTRTLSGQPERWNDKPLIDGHIAGDEFGNAMFAIHALGAALITLGGLVQLIPAIRNRFSIVHRWSGRVFMVLAWAMAIGGLWLVWGRGTYLSAVSAVAISIDALLILLFTALAWRSIRNGRAAEHRRWALRAFMVVNGVWFLRVGIMAWVILNQGPVGMTESLSGPADIALVFGSFLVPLAVLEVYLAAQRSRAAALKLGASGLILVMTALTALGAFGTVRFMWGPYV